MPAAGAAAALVVLAAGLPVAGLALKAGGLDNYRSSWRLVAGPETHGLPWWAPRLVGLAVIAAVVFVTDDKATSTRSRVWMTLARVAVALLGVVLVWVIWPIVVGPNSASHEVAWTLWLSVGAAVLCLPLAFVLGHHAARTGKLKWFALAMLPLAVPPIFLGAGYLKILNSSALSFDGRNPFLDSDGPRLGAMLLLVAKYVPFAIAAMWAAFLEIDPRLEEAAATAGVKPLDRALGILVPLAKPALVLGFVVVFVLSLREIDTIVLLTCDTVMRRIYTMVHYQRDAEVAALCVMLVVMEAAVFAAFALLAPRRAAAA
jgi:ABC-type Fe3+ transport system permease subunit